VTEVSSRTTVGLVANPVSGHDLRRLISGASIATNVEKVNVVRRLLSLGIERALDQHRVDRDGEWPVVELVPIDVQQTVEDSRAATSTMIGAGVGAIVVLGGDGTARAVASVAGDVPLLALSTGTNNAFGVTIDATVAGIAVGLVAVGTCSIADGCRRAKRLDVRVGDDVDLALVDVAVVDAPGVGARAIWDPSALREVVVTIAEPGSVGLSAIAAAAAPCARDDVVGRHLVFGRNGRQVLAPIAPGLVRTVGLASVRTLVPDETLVLRSTSGVLALDGEREKVLDGVPPTVMLRSDGPVVIDVPTVLDLAAQRRWLDR
jgi:predicted polyphosphate/ATP-dependent NAD kinase